MLIIIVILIFLLLLSIAGYFVQFYLERKKLKNTARDIFKRSEPTLSNNKVDCMVNNVSNNISNKKLTSLIGSLCIFKKADPSGMPPSCNDYYIDIDNTMKHVKDKCGLK